MQQLKVAHYHVIGVPEGEESRGQRQVLEEIMIQKCHTSRSTQPDRTLKWSVKGSADTPLKDHIL